MRYFIAIVLTLSGFCGRAQMFAGTVGRFAVPFSAPTASYTVRDTSFVVTGSTTAWFLRMRFPEGFDGRLTDSTKIFFFMPGVDEFGSAGHIGKYGFFHESVGLGTTWDGSVQLGNGLHTDVVYVELIPPTAWPTPAMVDAVIQKICPRFRVRVNALYYTGFSRGFNALSRHAIWLMFNNTGKQYKKVTAVYSARGAGTSEADGLPIGYPEKMGHWAKTGGGKMLFLIQYNDIRSNDRSAKNMIDSMPGSVVFYWTNLQERNAQGDAISHHVAGVNYTFQPTFNNFTPRSSGDTIIYATRPGGSSYLANSVQLTNQNQNIYQILMRMGDTTMNGSAPADLVISTVGDTVSLWSQWTALDNVLPQFTNQGIKLYANVVAGSPTSYTWTRISGPNTPTIANAGTQTATITNYIPGNYVYQVTASDGSATSTQQVRLWVRDLMQKNITSRRAGNRMVFHLGDITGNGVSATSIYVPYLNTYFQNRYGTIPMAGDTIYLRKNPNNGGVWNEVEIGDIGGAIGDPIIIEPYQQQFLIQGTRWRVGIRDSNIVCNVKFNGLGLKEKGLQNSPYGFRFIGGETADYGMVMNHFNNVEVNGYAIENADVGIFAKVNSTETNYYKHFRYYKHKKIILHDIYLKNIHGEGFYIGNTETDGASFSGGIPTVRGDSAHIYRIAINGTDWDGVQLANWGYGNRMHDIAVYKTGRINLSSQQWSVFMGGSCQGDLWNIGSYNATGGIAILGQGKSSMKGICIDSLNNGTNNADGIYNTQSNTGVLNVYNSIDPLMVHTTDSWIGNTTRRSIFHANNTSTMLRGAIRNNYSLSGANSGVITNANDTLDNNIAGSNPASSIFGNSSFFKVLNIMRTYPDSLVSFFDVEASLPNPPVVTPGANQNLPSGSTSTTLSGSATPGSGATIVSTVWSKVSGGAATITNPNSLNTAIAGMVAGTYVFRLTVTDSYSQVSTSDVTVVVATAATPPTVSAGTNQSITLPTNSVTLTGTATANGGRTIVSTTWSRVSGGAATITTPSALSTTVTGLVQGVYVFQLTALDSGGESTSSSIQVTVNAAPVVPTDGLRLPIRGRVIFSN